MLDFIAVLRCAELRGWSVKRFRPAVSINTYMQPMNVKTFVRADYR